MDVEHTADGRYVVVRGRRWRATDPAVPEDVAAALRRELMSARRAVGVALRAGTTQAERAARARVQRTKTALGERGTPWWEQDPSSAASGGRPACPAAAAPQDPPRA